MKKRKFLAIALALAMVLSLTPMAALAEEGTLPTDESPRVGERFSVENDDNITLYYYITSLGSGSEDGTAALTEEALTPSYKSSYTGEITVPNRVTYQDKTYTVTKIGHGAFAGSTVTSVTLPNTIEEIGESAFLSCVSLVTLTIPDTAVLSTIGKNAFANCSTLTSLDIPDSVTEIGENAFANDNFTELTIPAGVTTGMGKALNGLDPATVSFAQESPYEIEDGALYGDNGTVLEKVFDNTVTQFTVREGTTAIGEKTFYKFKGLTSVELPSSLKEIGENAFGQCEALTTADLPSSLTTLGELAFCNTKLISAIIPDGVTAIPDNAFAGAPLKTVVIPPSVTTIGECAFDGVGGDASGVTFVVQAENAQWDECAFGSDDFFDPVVPNQLTILIPSGSEDAFISEGHILKRYLINDDGAVKDGVTYGLAMAANTLAAQGAYEINAAVPTGADVTATSSDPNIAAVARQEDGKIVVTGVAPGSADIRVKISVNGFALVEGSCTVTVTEDGAVLPSVEDPETSIGASIKDEDKQTAGDVAGSVAADSTVAAAAQSAANSLNSDPSEKDALLRKGTEELKSSGDEKVSLYTQTYLEIEATQLAKESDKVTSITLDITPKMQVVASTAASSAGIDLTENTGNAVVVKAAEELKITKPAQIAVTLPDSFAGQPVYVKHEASSDTYFYQGTADQSGKLTFTSEHGFSPFTFSLTNEAVAEVDGVGYATFQKAVDAAGNGDTVEVLKDEGLSAVMSGSSRTISVKNSTGGEIAVTVNGKEYQIPADGTLKVSYTKPSSGGSSTSDDDEPTYSVTAPGKIKHGDVTIRPKSAEKGDTVTITVDPDEGYEVDEITVTDRKGNQLKVKDKGNGKYTFTMPASKVEIDVTFVKKSEAPAVRFDDVPKGAWYYDAAIYAAKNGLMSGTGDDMFSPDRDTSRAMIWVMLARLDDQDVSVRYGNWYDKAQAWAVSAGVSDGSAPNGSVTREQLAVMLYSFAKDQGYKRTGGVSLSGYVDAGSVSPWAVDALEWAVGNGLISGTGDGLLAPRATATRAQVAVILMNFCEDIIR